jgi:hypothetical protein
VLIYFIARAKTYEDAQKGIGLEDMPGLKHSMA